MFPGHWVRNRPQRVLIALEDIKHIAKGFSIVQNWQQAKKEKRTVKFPKSIEYLEEIADTC